jgi:hypothetical protein
MPRSMSLNRTRLVWVACGLLAALVLVLATPAATDVLGQTGPSPGPVITAAPEPGASASLGDATVVNQTNVPLSVRRTGPQLSVQAPAGTPIGAAGAACRPLTSAGNELMCTLAGANARVSVTPAGAATSGSQSAALPAPLPDAPSAATTGAVPPAPGVARPLTPVQLPLALPRTGAGLGADHSFPPFLALALAALVLAATTGRTLAARRRTRRS